MYFDSDELLMSKNTYICGSRGTSKPILYTHINQNQDYENNETTRTRNIYKTK